MLPQRPRPRTGSGGDVAGKVVWIGTNTLTHGYWAAYMRQMGGGIFI